VVCSWTKTGVDEYGPVDFGDETPARERHCGVELAADDVDRAHDAAGRERRVHIGTGGRCRSPRVECDRQQPVLLAAKATVEMDPGRSPTASTIRGRTAIDDGALSAAARTSSSSRMPSRIGLATPARLDRFDVFPCGTGIELFGGPGGQR
jgi:hypothetical protein